MISSGRHRAGLCLVAPLFLGASAGARAQATVPDSTPAASAVNRLPMLPPNEELGAPTALSILTAPSAGLLSVIVGTPRALEASAAPDSLAARVSRCIDLLGAPGAPVRSPWAPFDSATVGRAFVLVQLAAIVAPPAACPAATNPLVAVGGVQLVGSGRRVHPSDDLENAVVVVRGHAVVPVLAGRVATAEVRLTGDEPPRILAHELRLYFRADALSPDGRGRFAPAVVRVATADPHVERRIDIPDSVVARAWRELTPWRLARLRGAPHDRVLPRLDAPRDSVLGRARLVYISGDPISAAELTIRRRESVLLGVADARFASLLLGSTLLAYGDTASARVEYSDATRVVPCASLSDAPAFDRVLAATRPVRTRCSAISALRLLGSGLLVPGGAQWARGNRTGAALAAAVTLGLVGVAGERYAASRTEYRSYLGATGPSRIEPLLDRANSSRASARRYAVGAAVSWAATALLGVVAEKIHPPDRSGSSSRSRAEEARTP